jgi:hypothetical protein
MAIECKGCDGKIYGFHAYVTSDSGEKYCERCGKIAPSVAAQMAKVSIENARKFVSAINNNTAGVNLNGKGQ